MFLFTCLKLNGIEFLQKKVFISTRNEPFSYVVSSLYKEKSLGNTLGTYTHLYHLMISQAFLPLWLVDLCIQCRGFTQGATRPSVAVL